MADEIATEARWSAESRSIRQVKTLSALALGLAASVTLDDILQMAAKGVAAELGGDSTVVLTLSADCNALNGAAETHRKDSLATSFASELAALPAIRRVLDERRHVHFLLKEAGTAEAQVAEKHRLESCLVVPIVIGDKAAGLIATCFRDSLEIPKEENEVFARAIAAHCALAIQRERLGDEKKRDGCLQGGVSLLCSPLPEESSHRSQRPHPIATAQSGQAS